MSTRPRYPIGRALRLYFRLNADAMNYTPCSHRGSRAARLMPLIRAKYFDTQP